MADKKQYELAIKIAGMVDSSLASSCNLTKKQLRDIAKAAADANRSNVSFQDAMTKAGPGIDAAWGGVKKTVLATVEAMAVAGTALAAIGIASVGVGKEFESAMSSWAATASASEADYIKARDAAMEMGRTTSKTATESAAALEYMALAGWSVENSIKGLPGVLRLSEATGMDLARTSDLVTDSMSALGVEVKDLEGYLNVAAKANNKSNQTAEQLMEAYIGVGGTLKNLRIPTEESATALGVLANRGIKGSEAGNALNAVMINLTTGTGQAGKKMEELGISAFDSEGTFIGLTETLAIVNKSISDLNDEERNAALAAIGGKLHVDALNGLMSGLNTTVANGVTEWENLEAQLYDANGALKQMADTKLDNLQGDLAVFRSALEDSGIQIYENLKEPLREATQYGTQVIYDFSKNIVSNIGGVIPTIKRNMGEAKDAIEDFAEPLINVGGWMIENLDLVSGGLAAIGTTIVSLKVVKTIVDTASAMNALKVAMMSNPITAAIAVAALAGGAIVGISTKVKLANAELKKQKIDNQFGNISLSLGELDDAAKQILGDNVLNQLGIAMEELGKVSDIADKINDSSNSIRKQTWKVGMGMVMDESDQTQFGESINSMIANSINLVEQAQYTAHLNVSTLFGDGDETGQQLINGFDAMYDGINAQVTELGRMLGDAYSSAMEDGIIDTDEAKIIQELQERLGRVTDQVSQTQLDAKLERIQLEYSGKALDADTFQNLQKEIQNQITEAISASKQSYEYNLGALKLRLTRSQSGEVSTDDADYITQQAYDDLKQSLDNKFTEKKMDLELKGINFQTQTINDAFSESLQGITPQMGENLSTALSETINYIDWSGNAFSGWTYDQVAQWLNLDSLDKTTKAAIGDLWKGMEPQFQEITALKTQYEAAGKEIPEYIANGINNAAAIGIIAGSEDALWESLGNVADGSEAYQTALLSMKESGTYIPEAISDGISENKEGIKPGANDTYNFTKTYLQSKFSKFDINSKLNLNFSVAGNGSPVKLPGVVPHATGGIFNEPHFGVFAEAGKEAFIPIDHSQRSRSIWEQTGKELGVLGVSSVDNVTNHRQNNDESKITYAPVYHISGANEEQVRRATNDDYERFETFMGQYERTNQRLVY